MLKKFYYWLHKITSPPGERNEYSSGKWQSLVRNETFLFCKNIKGKILEIGCGEGLFLEKIVKIPSLEIWGIDNNYLKIEKAKKRMENLGFKNVNFKVENADKLSFSDNYFDAVICINTILNFDSFSLVKKTFYEAKRILKRKGKLIFDFRNQSNPFLLIKYRLAKYYDRTVKDLPLNCYSFKEIESLLKQLNFQIIQKKYLGFSFGLKRFSPIILLEVEKSEL